MFENTGSLLNSYNYGLVPNFGHGETGIKLILSEANQQNMMLRVLRCCAITPGGYYINFFHFDSFHTNNNLVIPLQISLSLQELKDKASCFYVLIVVDPSRCISAVDTNTSPYLSPIPCPLAALSLSLLPEPDIANNATRFFQLPVGRIQIEEQSVVLDEGYVPPCVSITSHSDLLELHAELEKFFSGIELHAGQSLQKILQRKQTNETAVILQKLCENITIFTAIHLAELKSVTLHQPPVNLINKVTSFARLFKNILDYNIGTGKEEFMNYCTEWCQVNHGELESCIADLSNHQYDHYNINSSIEKISFFAKVISRLFASLARLEYIGKRKDAGIFVLEQKQFTDSGRSAKRRGRFLSEGEERIPEPKVIVPPASSNERANESEPVYLGAAAPESAAQGAEFTARFVAYRKSLEQEVQTKLRQMSPGSTTHLGVQQSRWQKGTNVMIKLYGNHFSAEPSEQEFLWNGECNILNFDVKVSSTAPTIITILKFDVHVGGFLIARLRFDLEITAVVKKDAWKTIRVEPISTAFASYASQDRERVLDRVSEIRRVGIDIYLDCLSMHPGDKWKQTLEKEIKNRESFLLFWSYYAKQSEMVAWEWRTALTYKGISGIEPHPLCPVSEAEPPEELKELHFGDVYMLVREANSKNKTSKDEQKRPDNENR